MTKALWLLLALAAAGCSTDDPARDGDSQHAAGTTNPAVVTPAEAPAAAGASQTPDTAGDTLLLRHE